MTDTNHCLSLRDSVKTVYLRGAQTCVLPLFDDMALTLTFMALKLDRDLDILKMYHVTASETKVKARNLKM